jgi:hypothetical protein
MYSLAIAAKNVSLPIARTALQLVGATVQLVLMFALLFGLALIWYNLKLDIYPIDIVAEAILAFAAEVVEFVSPGNTVPDSLVTGVAP